MKLSSDAIKDFKALYKNKRGITLTDEEADQMGWHLLHIAELALKRAANR